MHWPHGSTELIPLGAAIGGGALAYLLHRLAARYTGAGQSATGVFHIERTLLDIRAAAGFVFAALAYLLFFGSAFILVIGIVVAFF